MALAIDMATKGSKMTKMKRRQRTLTQLDFSNSQGTSF